MGAILSMKNMTLLEHLKMLKVAMPLQQKDTEAHSKLTIFKAIKDQSKREGVINK